MVHYSIILMLTSRSPASTRTSFKFPLSRSERREGRPLAECRSTFLPLSFCRLSEPYNSRQLQRRGVFGKCLLLGKCRTFVRMLRAMQSTRLWKFLCYRLRESRLLAPSGCRRGFCDISWINLHYREHIVKLDKLKNSAKTWQTSFQLSTKLTT